MNRHTPRDIFPTLWDKFEQLISSQKMSAPDEVALELARGADGLDKWARQFPDFIKKPSLYEMLCVQQITSTYPDWVQGRQNAADPWIIAHACTLGAIIVTQEKFADKNAPQRNIKIPNVADNFGLVCMSFHELARHEGWVF